MFNASTNPLTNEFKTSSEIPAVIFVQQNQGDYIPGAHNLSVFIVEDEEDASPVRRDAHRAFNI